MAAPYTSSSSRPKVTLRFWGVRGSLPTPGPSTVIYGGNTSCVELRADGEIIILDAGTGIRPLGLQLASEFKGQPLNMNLLLTHTHWDHIQGFPFFAPAYNPKNKLQVLSFEGARKGLEATLSTQMESPYFPISMQQMPGNVTIQEVKDLSFEIGRVRVAAVSVNHPGVCVGYRLFTSAGSVVFIPDNELFERLKGQSVTPSNDSLPDPAAFARYQDHPLTKFAQGADILITDSQYDEAEYLSHIGWGHSCFDDSVGFAIAARVKRLFLFHHDPSHDDIWVSKMVTRARALAARLGGSTQVDAAQEGVEVELPLA
jgi:phosphoribosyl 1,2-cyclic phosphodiesterase